MQRGAIHSLHSVNPTLLVCTRLLALGNVGRCAGIARMVVHNHSSLLLDPAESFKEVWMANGIYILEKQSIIFANTLCISPNLRSAHKHNRQILSLSIVDRLVIRRIEISKHWGIFVLFVGNACVLVLKWLGRFVIRSKHLEHKLLVCANLQVVGYRQNIQPIIPRLTHPLTRSNIAV